MTDKTVSVPQRRKKISNCSDCDNTSILRAAAFNLASQLFPGNFSKIKLSAKLIEGLAKNYGNRRVHRFKEENEL